MGLIKGAVSFVRYTVDHELPSNFWDFVGDRVRTFSFQDIDDTLDELSIGWVSVHNMFDSEFAYSAYAAGDYVVLSLRVDERKVSPALLNKFCAKEEERIKKEKQLPRLSRGHRGEIKEQMQQLLIRKAVPVPAVYDLCWSLADNTVLFFSTSKKAQGTLEEFFKQTFDMHLVLQPPFLIAAHLLDSDMGQRLDALQPARFVGE